MDGRTAERVHHGGDHPGPRGNRQADEVLAVGPTGILRHRILLYVEARQPRRSAQQKQKRNEIPELNDVLANGRVEGGVEELNAPGESQHGGRDAEADRVGKRIHLPSEVAGRVGHARDAAVQAVE